MDVQVKAAGALESLCLNNADCQRAFLERDATAALMQLFSKIWSLDVKEQTACAIWSLAGKTKPQQKEIALKIGIPHLIDMLLSSSEKLQYVGCMGMIALSSEDMENQNKIVEQGGITPLVRLLRSPKTTHTVLLAVIQTLGILCVGLAHHNNAETQEKIAEEGALFYLVELLMDPPSEEIQVEVAFTLGCLVLGNMRNQETMQREPTFTYDVLLDLLELKDKELRLRAGFAVSVFAFNNTPQQLAIREAGGISYNCFDYFLDSQDEFEQCHAAFQIVVLARVIVDKDQVSLTATGVTQLISKLQSSNDDVVILAASLSSSLAHTRAGITDAMLTVGAVEALMVKLKSPNDQVRFACAVALGYLTFNRTAARKMLVAVRNTPGLYELMMQNIGKSPKISKKFTEEFETQKLIGIPCLSLEKHGGPSCDSYTSSKKTRPTTSQSLPTPRKPHTHRVNSRAFSASVIPARVQSAGSARTTTSMSQRTVTDSPFLKTKLRSWQDME